MSPILQEKRFLVFGQGAVLGGLGESQLVRMIIVRRAPRRPQQGIYYPYVFASNSFNACPCIFPLDTLGIRSFLFKSPRSLFSSLLLKYHKHAGPDSGRHLASTL